MRYHPYGNYRRFADYDNKFQRTCCGDADLCEVYTKLRPSDNCASYRPPRWCKSQGLKIFRLLLLSNLAI